jgi:hypothetical protein
MNRTFFILFLSCLTTIGIFKCSVNRIAGDGTGSETTNGVTATVRYQDGTPASFASVKIRPSWFLGDTGAVHGAVHGSSGIFDTMTDSSGRFLLKGIDTGAYSIEVIDTAKSQGALIQGMENAKNYGVVFLNPVSSIRGTINTTDIPDSAAIYVQVYGLQRVKRVSAKTGAFAIDSIAEGNYAIRIVTSLPTFMPHTVENIAIGASRVTSVDTITLESVKAWNCSKKVFLNTTPSGADVTEDIYNFPVLIRLTKDNFDFLTARTRGDDIRFTKPDNTPLSYQIERWDAGAGFAEIWVKADTVFGASDSRYFNMLWGNSDASDASSSGDVFDTAVGFQGVWHMNDQDSIFCTDATNNHYNGERSAMSPVSTAPGAIGNAQVFDGKENYIVISNTADSKLNFPQNGRYSVSAWVSTEALDLNYHCIVSKSNQQYGLQLNNQNLWQFFEFANKRGWQSTEFPAAVKTWKYVVGVRDGSKQYLYIDGALVDSAITLAADGSLRFAGDNVCIGKRPGETNRFWSGMIDEVRICSWPHGSNWIKLCYMNQRQNDALVVFK